MIKNSNIMELVFVILRKAWLIALTAVIFGGATYSYFKFIRTPVYSSGIKFIVNNITEIDEVGRMGITDYQASEKLANTCHIILTSDTILSKVADISSLDYTVNGIKGMLTIVSVNNTNVMSVTVTSKNKDHSYRIARVIGSIAPGELERIINAGSVNLFDDATDARQVADGRSTKSLLAAIIGALLVIGIITAREFFDNRIKSESDLKANFNIPIIGSIPKMPELREMGAR